MLKILDLFSGIGAFAKALTRLKIPHKVINFCENDPFAIISYTQIHGVPESLNLGDIRTVEPDKIPDYNVQFWGFPCGDISIAGRKEGIKEGTQSGLYYEGLRILKAKRPDYSIIENVKNLTSKQFKPQFEMILKDLEELGYNNYYKILDAKNYGIPQHRERVFVVSIKKDIDNGSFVFPEPFDNGLRLKDMLESEVDEKYFLSDEKCKNLITHSQDYCYTIDSHYYKGPSIYDLTNGKRQCVIVPNECICVGRVEGINGHDYIKRVYSEHGTSPTIPTCGGGNQEPKVLTKYRVRKLTPKECWRLMGFDDADIQKCIDARISNRQLYRQAGNSIVVNVLEEIFKNLWR